MFVLIYLGYKMGELFVEKNPDQVPDPDVLSNNDNDQDRIRNKCGC